MAVPRLELRRLHPLAIVPQRMTSESAGLDLAACLGAEASLVLAPGQRALVATGWALAIPRGHEGQVRPRSGLALEHGVTVLNAPGTIDADYRGELKVLLINLGQEPVTIAHGQRIAQLVVSSVAEMDVFEVGDLTPAAGSTRAERGFGSTGR